MLEVNRRWSPYGYVKNSAINRVDVDGMIDPNDFVNMDQTAEAAHERKMAAKEEQSEALAAGVASRLGLTWNGGEGSASQSQPANTRLNDGGKKGKKKQEKSFSEHAREIFRFMEYTDVNPYIQRFFKKLDESIMGHAQNKQQGGFVETMDGSYGSPGVMAKFIGKNDHIDLNNVFDPLGALTVSDHPFTLMSSLAADVASNTTPTVKDIILRTRAVAPATKARATGFVINPNSHDTVRLNSREYQNGAIMLFIKPNGELTITPDR